MINWDTMSVEEVALELGRGLQSLEHRLQNETTKRAVIRFPRSVIRPVAYYVRDRVGFIPDGVTARNIAYTLQATDVNRWIVNRFDLGLSAGSIFYKQGCVTMVSAMEAALSAVWRNRHPGGSPSKSFAGLIDALADEGVLTPETAALLHEARKTRNNIHLHRVRNPERNQYNVRVYNRIVLTEHRLLQELGRQRSR
jgi:hypothetical protein